MPCFSSRSSTILEFHHLETELFIFFPLRSFHSSLSSSHFSLSPPMPFQSLFAPPVHLSLSLSLSLSFSRLFPCLRFISCSSSVILSPTSRCPPFLPFFFPLSLHLSLSLPLSFHELLPSFSLIPLPSLSCPYPPRLSLSILNGSPPIIPMALHMIPNSRNSSAVTQEPLPLITRGSKTGRYLIVASPKEGKRCF